jgi:hypothetical protein
MKIIRIASNDNGSRPPLQDWNYPELPSGFAWCPDDFVSIFYSTTPAGFVDIEVKNDTVIAMTVNEEALSKFPSGDEKAVHIPTTDEILNALLGVSE